MLKFELTPLFCVRIYTHKHIHDTREEVSTKKSPSLGIKFIISKTTRKYIYIYIYIYVKVKRYSSSISSRPPPRSPTQPMITGLKQHPPPPEPPPHAPCSCPTFRSRCQHHHPLPRSPQSCAQGLLQFVPKWMPPHAWLLSSPFHSHVEPSSRTPHLTLTPCLYAV